MVVGRDEPRIFGRTNCWFLVRDLSWEKKERKSFKKMPGFLPSNLGRPLVELITNFNSTQLTFLGKRQER